MTMTTRVRQIAPLNFGINDLGKNSASHSVQSPYLNQYLFRLIWYKIQTENSICLKIQMIYFFDAVAEKLMSKSPYWWFVPPTSKTFV